MEKPLKVLNLKKFYGRIKAVRGVSFEVRPKEIFALIGPNGAGKSTILRVIATLLRPSGGDAQIYGVSVKEHPEIVRQLISYLPEDAGLYKNMSGLYYLRFMASLFTDDPKKIKEFVVRGAEICGLGERLQDKVGTYSKGMARKLLLARAVMTTPKLAILDEPTGGLDVVNALEIRTQIKRLAKEGMAVVLSSHNMLEIEHLSDRVAMVSGGTIYEIGTPQALKTKYHAHNLEEVFVKITKRK